MSIWKSIKGLFGQTIHYKDGVKVGESWDGFIPGTKNHYDANGSYVGHSDPGFIADQVHFDQYGSKVGESWTDDFGTTRHYADSGRVGTSFDGLTGSTSLFDDDTDSLFDQPDSMFDDQDSPLNSLDSFGDSDW